MYRRNVILCSTAQGETPYVAIQREPFLAGQACLC